MSPTKHRSVRCQQGFPDNRVLLSNAFGKQSSTGFFTVGNPLGLSSVNVDSESLREYSRFPKLIRLDHMKLLFCSSKKKKKTMVK